MHPSNGPSVLNKQYRENNCICDFCRFQLIGRILKNKTLECILLCILKYIFSHSSEDKKYDLSLKFSILLSYKWMYIKLNGLFSLGKVLLCQLFFLKQTQLDCKYWHFIASYRIDSYIWFYCSHPKIEIQWDLLYLRWFWLTMLTKIHQQTFFFSLRNHLAIVREKKKNQILLRVSAFIYKHMKRSFYEAPNVFRFLLSLLIAEISNCYTTNSRP